MGITSKTRKMLWAKSGNKCSICKSELFSNEEGKENLNIGEECHIISSQKKGPRNKEGLSNYDEYENLILLCKNHHKEIDELTETYTEEVIRYLKQNHENWVSSTLDNSIEIEKKSKPRFISRIILGKELLKIISDSQVFKTDYDEVETEEEADYIGGILQELQDYGDLCEMLAEPYDKVKWGLHLSEMLKQMEEKGYFLFAENNIERVKFGNGGIDNWRVATILIRKKDNPEIIKFDLNNI
ncbi:MAG: HNH endonuclease signature motif containing protein [Cytophagales bacterium]